jgi:hypothetical protein
MYKRRRFSARIAARRVVTFADLGSAVVAHLLGFVGETAPADGSLFVDPDYARAVHAIQLSSKRNHDAIAGNVEVWSKMVHCADPMGALKPEVRAALIAAKGAKAVALSLLNYTCPCAKTDHFAHRYDVAAGARHCLVDVGGDTELYREMPAVISEFFFGSSPDIVVGHACSDGGSDDESEGEGEDGMSTCQRYPHAHFVKTMDEAMAIANNGSTVLVDSLLDVHGSIVVNAAIRIIGARKATTTRRGVSTASGVRDVVVPNPPCGFNFNRSGALILMAPCLIENLIVFNGDGYEDLWFEDMSPALEIHSSCIVRGCDITAAGSGCIIFPGDARRHVGDDAVVMIQNYIHECSCAGVCIHTRPEELEAQLSKAALAAEAPFKDAIAAGGDAGAAAAATAAAAASAAVAAVRAGADSLPPSQFVFLGNFVENEVNEYNGWGYQGKKWPEARVALNTWLMNYPMGTGPWGP